MSPPSLYTGRGKLGWSGASPGKDRGLHRRQTKDRDRNRGGARQQHGARAAAGRNLRRKPAGRSLVHRRLRHHAVPAFDASPRARGAKLLLLRTEISGQAMICGCSLAEIPSRTSRKVRLFAACRVKMSTRNTSGIVLGMERATARHSRSPSPTSAGRSGPPHGPVGSPFTIDRSGRATSGERRSLVTRGDGFVGHRLPRPTDGGGDRVPHGGRQGHEVVVSFRVPWRRCSAQAAAVRRRRLISGRQRLSDQYGGRSSRESASRGEGEKGPGWREMPGISRKSATIRRRRAEERRREATRLEGRALAASAASGTPPRQARDTKRRTIPHLTATPKPQRGGSCPG